MNDVNNAGVWQYIRAVCRETPSPFSRVCLHLALCAEAVGVEKVESRPQELPHPATSSYSPNLMCSPVQLSPDLCFAAAAAKGAVPLRPNRARQAAPCVAHLAGDHQCRQRYCVQKSARVYSTATNNTFIRGRGTLTEGVAIRPAGSACRCRQDACGTRVNSSHGTASGVVLLGSFVHDTWRFGGFFMPHATCG